MASIIGNVEVVQVLLSRGANIAVVCTDGCNCLDAAIQSNKTDVCFAIISDDR